MRRVAAVVALLALGGCGGGPERHARIASGPFADPAAPLQVDDRGAVAAPAGVSIRDVSFAGRRRRIDAFLVRPRRQTGRRAAVILLHGSGGSRADFLESAITYARRGAVALTMTAPSEVALAPPPGDGPQARLQWEQAVTRDDVVGVRRAVDYLRTVPAVDPARIGVVGWSEGAKTGAMAAGAEPRIRAFVLMSGGALPVSAYAAAAPPSLRPAVRRVLGPVDPLRWIARARPGTLFLQNGLRDEVVPRAALKNLVRAAPPRTRVRWYAAGHALNRAAVRDQVEWLSGRLGIRH